MTQRQPQADKAAHRKADEVAGCAIQFGDERGGVIGEFVDGIARRGHLAVSLAAMVEPHAPIIILQASDLVIEHGVVHEEPVGEHQGVVSAAAVFKPQSGAVGAHVWHGSAPDPGQPGMFCQE